MSITITDGGRAAAGIKKGKARDCGVRALAIACPMEYMDAYRLVIRYGLQENFGGRRAGGKPSSPETGIWKETMDKIMADLGWRWTATMKIGSGCRVHVRAGELPQGRLILRLSGHYAAFADGVLMDSHDSSRDGTRCVYGYWSQR